MESWPAPVVSSFAMTALSCLIVCASPVLAALPTTTPTLQSGSGSFLDRRQRCFDAVQSEFQRNSDSFSGGNAFWAAEAMFEAGNTDAGCKLSARGLDRIEPDSKNRWLYGGNSGFTAWPGIDCYIRFNRFFDDALKTRFKRIYTGAVFYKRLTTSNHTIMAATTRYLATQAWGPDAFSPDPFYTKDPSRDVKSMIRFTADDPTGEKFLRQRVASAVAGGPGEYASMPYGAENVLPLLTLAECASDKTLREPASIAYEACIAQLAGAYLHGHCATFSTRSYPDMLNQQPWGIASLLWMYYGGVDADLTRQWGLRAATADWQLPAVLASAGDDRDKPYVFRSLMNGWALYHYVNRSYALFSASPKAKHPKLLGQNYPCGVMWDEPDDNKASQLWLTNPAADAPDGGELNNRTNGIHTHGVTRFEQQVQHEDACLCVFNIDPTFRNPYVLGYIPGGYRACINDSKQGRIFLHYGSVMVAITSIVPFEWKPDQPLHAPAGKPHVGDSEFRIALTKTAVALETALPSDFGNADAGSQLQAFKSAVVSKASLNSVAGNLFTASYTDRKGNVLVSTFDGTDSISGATVDYDHWPVVENPWMQQNRGGELSISDGVHKRIYDFTQWSVNDLHP